MGTDDGTLGWSDLIAQAAQLLGERLGGDRRQEARWLVERVSGYSGAELIVNGDERVGARSVAFFDQLLARRSGGEPLQYVLGRWGFRTLDLLVAKGALIPRPETEVVAGIAIDAARAMATTTRENGPIVVDLGTGTGAIALSIAAEVSSAEVWAADVSADALSIARANLAGLGRAASRVRLVEGSWFDALPSELRGRVDVLVSNPPYVAEAERGALPSDVVDWEPELALFAPDDGRAHVAHLIEHGRGWLRPGGVLVIEMAPHQTAWAAERAADHGYADARIVPDLAGRPRALAATAP